MIRLTKRKFPIWFVANCSSMPSTDFWYGAPICVKQIVSADSDQRKRGNRTNDAGVEDNYIDGPWVLQHLIGGFANCLLRFEVENELDKLCVRNLLLDRLGGSLDPVK
jgi:hypothetical protein